jgi:murein DD-endopeptidase MepM/ murein hydrolase activator NlpD
MGRGSSQRLEAHKVLIVKKKKIALIGFVSLLALNLLLPTKIQNPVEGCGRESYNQKSFWHPWGDHRHAGIDIFAKKGTKVRPAIGGIVVAAGHNLGAGGNCILILSSGWRLHYYAHLNEIDTHIGAIVTQKSVIGKVGNTGNAKGKPHHLHYSISSIIPQGDWRWEAKQLLFYINPINELER